MSTAPEEGDPEKKAEEDEDAAVGDETQRAGFANEVKLRDQKKRTSDPAIPVVPRPAVGQVYDPSQHANDDNYDARLVRATLEQSGSKRARRPTVPFEATLVEPKKK